MDNTAPAPRPPQSVYPTPTAHMPHPPDHPATPNSSPPPTSPIAHAAPKRPLGIYLIAGGMLASAALTIIDRDAGSIIGFAWPAFIILAALGLVCRIAAGRIAAFVVAALMLLSTLFGMAYIVQMHMRFSEKRKALSSLKAQYTADGINDTEQTQLFISERLVAAEEKLVKKTMKQNYAILAAYILLAIATIWYLNRPQVKDYFAPKA